MCQGVKVNTKIQNILVFGYSYVPASATNRGVAAAKSIFAGIFN
jgi:hypothetical protein